MLYQIINPILFSLCLTIFIFSCATTKKPNPVDESVLKPISSTENVMIDPEVHQFPLTDRTPESAYQAAGLEKKKPAKRNYHKRYRSHPSLRLTK
jgi:hypothetical protein